MKKKFHPRVLPFVPKSNALLFPGDFWGFQFAADRYAAGRVIDLPWQHGEDDRRLFLAGLLDWSGSLPPTDDDIAGKKVLKQGIMHVRAFSFSKWTIDGHRELQLDNIIPWLFKTAQATRFVQQGFQKERLGTKFELQSLPVASVWGMTVIVEHAKKYFGSTM